MSDLVTYTPPSGHELEQTWQLAERFAKTEFVPAAIKGRPEAVMACMLAGRELGIGPMQALQKIHIIQGRPTLSAELMASLVRRAGHRIRTIESDDTVATVEGCRADDPQAPEKITWTIEDAKRAKLTGKDNWQYYPKAMLWARAVSALCRRLFPDVLAGMSYLPEEVEGGQSTTVIRVDAGSGEVIEDAPGPQGAAPPPAGPGAADPTDAQIDGVRSVEEAKALVRGATEAFRGRVQDAMQARYGVSAAQFWKDTSRTVADWKQVLTDAARQSGETGPSEASPAPSAAAAATVHPSGGGSSATPGTDRAPRAAAADRRSGTGASSPTPVPEQTTLEDGEAGG